MQSVTYYFTFWKNVILLQLHITYYFIALFLSIVCIIAFKIEFSKPSLTFFWHWKQVIMKTTLKPTYIEFLWHFNLYIHENIISFEIIDCVRMQNEFLSVMIYIEFYQSHCQSLWYFFSLNGTFSACHTCGATYNYTSPLPKSIA